MYFHIVNTCLHYKLSNFFKKKNFNVYFYISELISDAGVIIYIGGFFLVIAFIR